MNQFEKADNAHNMQWLPQRLPDNVRFVVSTLAGEAYDALMVRRDKPEVVQVTGLGEKEIKKLVHDYLKEIRKNFPNEDDEKAFYDKVKLGNPLYILVALEELRVFGEFYKLADRIKQLPHNVPDLFDQVLKRIEDDFSEPLVRDCMAFIACGRQGMTAEELQGLLFAHAPQQDAMAAQLDKLPDMIWARLYRAFRSYLFDRSGVIDFFHGQLKEAVGKRYLKKEVDRNAIHKIIADYFEKQWREPYIRAVEELPHQRTKASDWNGVKRVLCDLRFIEAKCAAGMTYELIADYNTALDALPEAQEERQRELKHQERVAKYAEDLIAFSRGEISHLDIIPSVEPWSNEKIRKETERIITNPTRLDLIQAFSQFVNLESSSLARFGYLQSFCLQQAYNSARNGPVAAAANDLINKGSEHIMLLQLEENRSEYVSNFGLSKILASRNSITSVDISADGKKAISGCEHGTFSVWDIARGELVNSFKVYTNSSTYYEHGITCVSISSDGKRAVSGCRNGAIQFWDLEAEEMIWTLYGHKQHIQSVSISPDGRKAVSGSWDRTARIWDLENRKPFQTFNDTGYVFKFLSDGKSICVNQGALRMLDINTGRCHKEMKSCSGLMNNMVDITPDGRMAVVTWLHFIWLVNVDDDVCLKTIEGVSEGKIMPREDIRTLKGFFGRIAQIAITADGKKAITGGLDRTIRVWDLENAKCLKIFWDHPGEKMALAITPDGRIAITGGYDGALRVWDIEKGEFKGLGKGHLGPVRCLNFTPDARHVFSGSVDGTIRKWRSVDGKYERIFRTCHRDIEDLDLAPDGEKIAYGREPGYAIIADYGYGEDTNESIKNYDEYGTRDRLLNAQSLWTLCVSFSPDGSMIAASGADDPEELRNPNDAYAIRMWDFVNFKEGNPLKFRGHKASVQSFVFTPDGKRIISGSYDKSIRIWDIATGKAVILGKHKEKINKLAISHDGRKAVSCSIDRILCIWDLSECKSIRIINDFDDGYVNSVKITVDGRYMFTVSKGTIQLWDFYSGQCLANLARLTPFSMLSDIEPSGFFSVGTVIGEVVFYNMVNLSIFRPIVTCKRIWLHGRGHINDGQWEENVGSTCPWCHKRFIINSIILNLIKTINSDANMTSDKSPCLELPDEAWDEPRLISECPLCHKPLKFNPFIVDNRDRYSWVTGKK